MVLVGSVLVPQWGPRLSCYFPWLPIPFLSSWTLNEAGGLPDSQSACVAYSLCGFVCWLHFVCLSSSCELVSTRGHLSSHQDYGLWYKGISYIASH